MKRLFFSILILAFWISAETTVKVWAQETPNPTPDNTSTALETKTSKKAKTAAINSTGSTTPQPVAAAKPGADANGSSTTAKATATPDYGSQHFFVELGYVSFAPYVLNAPATAGGNYTLTTNNQTASLVSASVRFRDVKPWNLEMPDNQENVTHQFADISMLNFGVAISGSSPTSIQASNAVAAGNIYGQIYESLDFLLNILFDNDPFSNFSEAAVKDKEQLTSDKTKLGNPATPPYVWDLGFYYAFNSNRSSLNLLQQIAFGPIGAVALPNGKNPPIELVGGAMVGWSEFPSFLINSADNEVSTGNGFPSFGLVHSFIAFISCNLPVGGNYITLDAETATAFDSSFNTWSISLGYTIPIAKLWTDLFGGL